MNLDSVYEIDNKPVYALAKNKTEEANLFNLKVSVVFVDGSISEDYTKAIKIVGKAKDTTKKGKVNSAEEVSSEGRYYQSNIDSHNCFYISIYLKTQELIYVSMYIFKQ